MNDDSLKKKLAELPVPPPDETARERALHRALVALKNSSGRSEEKPRLEGLGVFWRGAVLSGAAALGMVVLWLVGRPQTPEAAMAAGRTLQQMEILFPGRVNAVIERDGEVDLDLTEGVGASSEQPVLVEFSRGEHVLRVLSYSGRRICVDLGGTMACFEPLATADGDVILAGENFLWNSRDPRPQSGYRVDARILDPAS